MWKAITTVWAIGAMLTFVYAIRNFDCQTLTHEQCRSFAVADSFYGAVVWPFYWTFEATHS